MCQSCTLFVSEARIFGLAGILFTYTPIQELSRLAIFIDMSRWADTDLTMEQDYTSLQNIFLSWVRKHSFNYCSPAGCSCLTSGMCRRNEQALLSPAEVREAACRASTECLSKQKPLGFGSPPGPVGLYEHALDSAAAEASSAFGGMTPKPPPGYPGPALSAAPPRHLAEGPRPLRTAAFVSVTGRAALSLPSHPRRGRPAGQPVSPHGGAAAAGVSLLPVTAILRREGRASPARQSAAALFVMRAAGPWPQPAGGAFPRRCSPRRRRRCRGPVGG